MKDELMPKATLIACGILMLGLYYHMYKERNSHIDITRPAPTMTESMYSNRTVYKRQ